MKQTIFILLLSFVLLLSGCSAGKVSTAQKIIGDSLMFTQAEIKDAMEVAMAHFQAEFEGCTLLTMEYSEEKSERSAPGWAETYGAGEGIVLLSSFEVDDKGGDGSFNPGDTYHNWQWVLVRSDGGDWELKTWGYG